MRISSFALGVAVAFVAGGAALAADAPLTLAVTPPPVADEGWQPYVKAYGGVTAPNTLTFDGVEYDVDAGWLLGGAVGAAITENIAVELDGTYSSAAYSGSGDLINAGTLMANVVVSADVSDQVAVYAGVGLGGVGAQYDDGTASDWAYTAGGQIFAGVEFAVADNVSIFGEARYQAAFDTITVDHGGHDDELGVSRSSLLAGVKFGF